MAAAIVSFAVYSIGTDASSYTSNNLAALGSVGRPIVVFSSRSVASMAVPTATIGGKAMELISSSSAGTGMQSFFVGDEGDSGEVTISGLGTTAARGNILMARVTGLDLTYGRDGQGQTTANNTAFNVNFSSPLAGDSAGGVIVAANMRGATGTTTWTGITEIYESNVESANNVSYADDVFTTTGNKSITANSSTATNAQTRAVALRDGPTVIASQRFDPSYKAGHVSLRGDNSRALHTNGIYHDDYVLGVTEAGGGKYYVEFFLHNSYNLANTRVGIADKAQLTLDNGTTPGNSFYGYSFAGDIWADGADTGVDTGWGAGAVYGSRICLEIDDTAKTIRARLDGGTWSSTQNYSGGSLATVRWAVCLNNDDEEVAIADSVHWAFTPSSGYGEIAAGAVAQDITLPLLTDADTLYAPTVTPGPVDIVLPLLTDADTLYAPTLTVGPVNITLPLLTDGDTLYAPTVTPAGVNITLPLITDADTLYAPALTVGPVNIALPFLSDPDTLYPPTVANASGPQDITLPFLIDADTLYPPIISVAGSYRGHGAPPLVEDTIARQAKDDDVAILLVIEEFMKEIA